MKTIRITLLAGALAMLAGVPALTQSGQDLFQQALVKEQADGDLRAAIAIYERIVRDFRGDRTLAAKALVQLGKCHERLGNQEARKAYEQVLKDYVDQKEAAGYARTRLAAMRRPAAELAGPTIQARRLLSGRLDEGFAALSGTPTPNGRSLVQVDSTGMNLIVRDLATGASRLITNRGSEKGSMAYSEIVSPDGRRVAYAWYGLAAAGPPSATMELRVVGMDGSGDRLLREESSVYPGSWSHDGRHIAAQVSQGVDSRTEIAWISVDDGSKTTLGTFPSADGLTSHSPDDRFVAVQFQVPEDSGRRDISLLPTKGGSVVPLVDHPADDELVGWMPGTSDLLFTSDRSGNRDLWAIRVGEDGRAGSPHPVRRGIGEMQPMGFTRDGSLFYSNYTLQYNIFIAPFDESSGRIAVSEAKPLGGRGSNMRPSWSPNGEYLVFARRKPGGPGQRFEEIICVRNTKTGEERVLAEHIAPATVPPPTWFPDGRSLLVLGIPQADRARSGGSDVPSAAYRIDLVAGVATRLFELPPSRSWWFGPGLVATPGADCVIHVYDGRMVLRHLQSGREDELYRDAALGPGLVFTPDGSELVFAIGGSARATGQQRVKKFMAMPARGGEARELITIPPPAGIIGWTADGRSLLLLVRNENGQAIARVARAGGKIERLSPVQKDIRNLSLSPDGRRVAYWIQENEAEIWVLENVKEALARAR